MAFYATTLSDVDIENLSHSWQTALSLARRCSDVHSLQSFCDVQVDAPFKLLLEA
jgi:hypothetical protein